MIRSNAKSVPWILSSLFVALVTAWFSVGFHQYDEHWQILEFLGFRLGVVSKEQLPWEFAAEARSWIQPLLYEGLVRPLRALGFESRMSWAYAARLGSVILAWLSHVLLWNAWNRFRALQGSEPGSPYVFFLFWPVWWLGARTSSEGLSASFFLLGLAFLLAAQGSFLISSLAGFFLALVCFVRFQAALMVLGVLAAFFWGSQRKFVRLNYSGLFSGLAIGGLVGVLCDWIGYGHVAFPLLNYFAENVGSQKLAQLSSVGPWWHYLTWSFEQFPPLSILVWMGVGLGLFASPTSVLAGATLPFLIFHFVISAKQARFLFPLLPLFPLIWFQWKGWFRLPLSLKRAGFFLNFLAVVYLAVVPASTGMGAIEWLNTEAPHGFTYLTLPGQDPFQRHALRLNFYLPTGSQHLTASSTEDAVRQVRQSKSVLYWVYQDYMAFDLPSGIPADIRAGCSRVYMNYPQWAVGFDKIGFFKRSAVVSIWKCASRLEAQNER